MLEIQNLEKSFGQKQVLFGVDFKAESGQILGLIGKNGAGKTTIFHSILRFLEYSGRISFEAKLFLKILIGKLAIYQKNEV